MTWKFSFEYMPEEMKVYSHKMFTAVLFIMLKLEMTLISANRSMDKQSGVYSCKEILLCKKMER